MAGTPDPVAVLRGHHAEVQALDFLETEAEALITGWASALPYMTLGMLHMGGHFPHLKKSFTAAVMQKGRYGRGTCRL